MPFMPISVGWHTNSVVMRLTGKGTSAEQSIYASKVKDLKEASKPTSMVEQSAQTQWVRETKIKFTIISKCTRV